MEIGLPRQVSSRPGPLSNPLHPAGVIFSGKRVGTPGLATSMETEPAELTHALGFISTKQAELEGKAKQAELMPSLRDVISKQAGRA